jgi:hypothetical protein
MRPGIGTHIDHCWPCGRVRGILCGTCNTGPGLRDHQVLESAAAYVKAHDAACGGKRRGPPEGPDDDEDDDVCDM